MKLEGPTIYVGRGSIRLLIGKNYRRLSEGRMLLSSGAPSIPASTRVLGP